MLRLVVIASVLVCCLGAAPRARSPRLDGRIVGGSDADIADYPYMLSFLYFDRHLCGAAIISPIWAITAAHCSNGKNVTYISMRAGSSILDESGSVHQASKLINHENFNSLTDNDIAVIQVSTPFPLGDNVQIIPLASSTPATGVEVTITGWGHRKYDGSNSKQLQVVNVPVVDHATCTAIYVNGNYHVTEHMLCAGLPEGGKDSCQNDSGGPAVANGQLVGIVSWGNGCAWPNFPGVYTDVASLRSWVTQNTGV